MAGESSSSVQSVDRALRILAFLASTGEAGVTEMAADLDVHKSTAFRLVSTLEAHDLVEQTEDRGKYRLGVGLLRLAGATASRLDLVQESRATTRDLASVTGETVNIAVISDGRALYIDQAVGSSTLQPHQWVGMHVPLHATSNGKILMSELTEDRLRALLQRLESFTDRTLTDSRALRADLILCSERGYAIAVDELEEGLTAAAVPIRNASGDIVASLSISGATFRIAPRLNEILPRLIAAGQEISARMGHVGGVGAGSSRGLS